MVPLVLFVLLCCAVGVTVSSAYAAKNANVGFSNLDIDNYVNGLIGDMQIPSTRWKGKPGDIVTFNTDNDFKDSGFYIDDGGTGNDRELWTSDRLKKSFAKIPTTFKANDLVSFGDGGELLDSGFRVDDTSPPSSTVLWSSSKVDSLTPNVRIDDGAKDSSTVWSSSKVQTEIDALKAAAQTYTKNATNGNLGIYDSTGALNDLQFKIDDGAAVGDHVLWTSQKITKSFMGRANGVKGRVALFDGSGGVSDSGAVVDDSAAPSPTVYWSSSKIQDAIPKIADDSPADAKTIWSSQKITSLLQSSAQQLVKDAVAGEVAILKSDGQVVGSGIKMDDAAAASPSVVWSSAKLGQTAISAATAAVTDRIKDSDVSSTTLWSSAKTQQEINKTVGGNAGTKMNLVPKAVAKNLAVFDAAGQAVDGGSTVNDAGGPAANILWSSAKVDAQIAQASQSVVPKPTKFTEKNLTVFDAAGNVADSGAAIDDAGGPSASVVWTSDKTSKLVKSLIDDAAASPSTTSAYSSMKTTGMIDAVSKSKISRVPGAVANHVALFKTDGQVQDTGLTVDDAAAPSPTVIWSSKKTTDLANQLIAQQTSTSDNKMDKPTSATAKNVAIFDGKGGVVDGGYSIDDAAPASATVIWTSKKMDQMVTGSKWAVIDDTKTSTASPWSSDKTASSINAAFATSMQLVPSAKAGNLSVFDAKGSAADSGLAVNDAGGPDASTLWSSAKMMTALQGGYMKKVAPTTANALASLDPSGQGVESGYTVDDASAMDPKVLWSSKKMVDTFLPVSDRKPNYLISVAADGKFGESVYTVDPAASAGPTVIWPSSRIQSMGYIASAMITADYTPTVRWGTMTFTVGPGGTGQDIYAAVDSGTQTVNVIGCYVTDNVWYSYSNKSVSVGTTNTRLGTPECSMSLVNDYIDVRVYVVESGKVFRVFAMKKESGYPIFLCAESLK